MTMVALGDIAEVNPRLSERPGSDELVSFLPMASLGTDGTTEAGEERPFAEVSKGYTPFLDGDLLIAKITPCFQNNKIGQARIDHRVGVGSTEFHVVRPRLDVADARYLLHFLRRDQVRAEGERRMTGSGGQRRVPASFLQHLQLPLPPLDEQRRIAHVLDSADRLTNRVEGMTAALDGLGPALFRALFQDLADEWPVRQLGEFVSDSRLGLVRAASAQAPDLPHAYMKMDAISRSGHLLPEKFTRVAASEVERATTSVRDGDLLFNTRNTRDLVGKSVVYRGASVLYNNNLMRLRFTPDVTADYVHGYLWSRAGVRQLEARKVGTTSVFAIYAKALATVTLPVPPRSLQTTFSQALAGAAATREDLCQRRIRFDGLRRSLQVRAFSGQL